MQAELGKVLESKGLDTQGLKEELINRIYDHEVLACQCSIHTRIASSTVIPHNTVMANKRSAVARLLHISGTLQLGPCYLVIHTHHRRQLDTRAPQEQCCPSTGSSLHAPGIQATDRVSKCT